MIIIQNSQDHKSALSRLEQCLLADPLPGSSEEDELENLASAIESYEKIHFPIPLPTTDEAKRLREEQSMDAS